MLALLSNKFHTERSVVNQKELGDKYLYHKSKQKTRWRQRSGVFRGERDFQGSGQKCRKKVRFKTYVVNSLSALFYSWKSYQILVESLVPISTAIL